VAPIWGARATRSVARPNDRALLYDEMMRKPRRPSRSLWVLVLPIALLTLLREARASDADWHKITTQHFELYTDLDAEAAVDAAKELEDARCLDHGRLAEVCVSRCRANAGLRLE